LNSQLDILDTVGGDKKRLLSIEKQLVHDANQTIRALEVEVANWRHRASLLEKEVEELKKAKPVEEPKLIQSVAVGDDTSNNCSRFSINSISCQDRVAKRIGSSS
jgi:hypothetical protein